MNNKKYLLIGTILLIIGIIFGFSCSYLVTKIFNHEDSNNKDKNQKLSTSNEETIGNKYYINFNDNAIPGATYKLEMDEEGNFSLEISYASSAVDVTPITSNYNGKLNDQQLIKVKAILNSFNKENELSTKEYLFKYDYNNPNIELTYSAFDLLTYTLNSIENIARKEEKIGEQTREEFGNEFLNSIYEIIEEENRELENGYRKIQFTDFIIFQNSEISLTQTEKINFTYKDNKVYFNNTLTNIESDLDYIYLVDINEDGISEIITETSDYAISPIRNYYHIYQYENNTYKEIATINITGSIEYFYIKDNNIKVKYIPYEATPNTVGEEYFKINY